MPNIATESGPVPARPGRPSGASPAIRPLGALETMFWHLDQNGPVHFVVAAEVEGRTTVRGWEGAIRSAQRRHPLLSCSIGVGGDHLPYFRRGSSPIPLRMVADPPPQSWEGEIGRELASPFSPDHAPLARAVLLHSEDRCVFILAAHHSVADGLSLAYVIRDVVRSLSGGILEPGGLPPSLEDLLGSKESLPASTATPDREAPPPSSMPSNDRTNGRDSPVVRRLRLSPGMTRELQDRSRREGTTIHAALSSALLLASEQRPGSWGTTPIRIFSPIDIRKLAGLREECVLAIGAGTISIESDPGMTFWELARRARQGLQPARTREGVLEASHAVSRMLPEGIDARAVSAIASHTFAHEVLLTNLGKDAIEADFGPLRIEGLWGPAVLLGDGGEQTIGVATLNDSLTLLHTSHSPIPDLLGTIERTLAAACDGGPQGC